MNADISYNSRVANQASLGKAKIHKELDELCKKTGIDVPKVLTTDVEPQLSENNLWIEVVAEKLKRINIALGSLETA